MRYLDFLRQVHERLAPPTYLEIGIRNGGSLALSRARSVGIDPSYRLTHELGSDVALFRETSDAYFARPDPGEALDGRPIGLAFIDGMHLAELALRDFANVERHAHWTSVVVLDDVLPRTLEEAARDRRTRDWTGDVYKVLEILARHRPDLIRLRVDTEPTGLGLVLGLDPGSRVLDERADELAREVEVPDPQDVPAAVLERRDALDPEAVLAAGFWARLRDARERDRPRRRGLRALRRAVAADVRSISRARAASPAA